MTTIHVVSHTHWDREWYLPFQLFRLKLVHLVDRLLELLEGDPAFRTFTLDGQTAVLDDYLQMRPENEARLRSLVQAGRLLIGPWHILPDEFLVSPEATVRNLLAGERDERLIAAAANFWAGRIEKTDEGFQDAGPLFEVGQGPRGGQAHAVVAGG